MSKTLQIINEIFEYPEQGTSPSENWGESATGWAEAVTDVLATIQGPNDILITNAVLNDNQIIPIDIIGLRFSTIQVIHVKVEYIIERIIGATVLAESGIILGNYDGVNFNITTETCGDAGVSLSVTNAGQFQYTSTLLNHDSCQIKFKASAISN